MKTYVIPFMSKEETDRLLQELKEISAGRGQGANAAKQTPAEIEAPAGLSGNPDPSSLKIGSL